MNLPPPLTLEESERIRRWQRNMYVYYAAAIALLALACVMIVIFSETAWIRRGTLLIVIALVAGGTVVQFRERCPRCGLRLGSQGRPFLPERCRRCKVAFGQAE